METARPSANLVVQNAGAQPSGEPFAYDTANEVADKINRSSFGTRFLVVGHSKTVGNIAKALGAPLDSGFSISENDFGNPVVVKSHHNGSTVALYEYTADGALKLVK